jgi:hypothetical protein
MATTNNTVLDYDASTGEIVFREMTAEEIELMPTSSVQIETNPDGLPA